jgi:4-hydroxy-3-methylbut-2-enyl diphosphate reductase
VDGLIHISQIANKKIAKPSEVLNIGDIVQAKITDIKAESRQVALSIRALFETEQVPESDAESVLETTEPEPDDSAAEIPADTAEEEPKEQKKRSRKPKKEETEETEETEE